MRTPRVGFASGTPADLNGHGHGHGLGVPVSCAYSSQLQSTRVESSRVTVESYSVRIRWLSTGSDSISLLGGLGRGGAGRPPSEDSAESLCSGSIPILQDDCLPVETMDCDISGWLSQRGLLLGCRFHPILSCPAAQGAGILLDSQ